MARFRRRQQAGAAETKGKRAWASIKRHISAIERMAECDFALRLETAQALEVRPVELFVKTGRFRATATRKAWRKMGGARGCRRPLFDLRARDQIRLQVLPSVAEDASEEDGAVKLGIAVQAEARGICGLRWSVLSVRRLISARPRRPGWLGRFLLAVPSSATIWMFLVCTSMVTISPPGHCHLLEC